MSLPRNVAHPGPRFLILDGLRLVFALIVVVIHTAGPVRIERGYLAVDFFFILSGFVLTWAYWERAHEPGIFRTFVIDRVARLYPLHLATLLLLVVIDVCYRLSTGNGSLGDPGRIFGFLLNLGLLQAIGPAVELVKALWLGAEQPYVWNGPAWSISVELYGNLALASALLALVSARWGVAPWAVLIVAVGSYALLSTTCMNLSCEDFFDQTSFGPIVHGLGCWLLRGLGGMALGVLCCGVVRHLPRKPQCIAISAPVTLLSGVALFGLVLVDRPDYGDIAAIAVACVLVSSVAIYEHRNPLLSMPRLSAALLVAGALSYAVYLVHTPVIILAELFLPGSIKQGLLPTVLIALLVLAVAFPVHYLFELPLKRATRAWLCRLLARQMPPATA